MRLILFIVLKLIHTKQIGIDNYEKVAKIRISKERVWMKMITFDSWSTEDLPQINHKTETKGALELIKWSYDTYQAELVYACSFGIEAIVLLELISRINPNAQIIFLDTNYHFQETYDIINKVKERYPNFRIKLQQPELTIDEQTESHGKDLYKTNPNKCCELRKIIPLQKAIAPSTAWLSGIRREQSLLRQKTEYINLDEKFEKIKLCPLIHWTWKDVWHFVESEKLDYNVLHDKGYPSIGCEPCTKRVLTSSDDRSGRWNDQTKTECGLHPSS